jgi:formiminotetrahydrofolate cyclodeaminase
MNSLVEACLEKVRTIADCRVQDLLAAIASTQVSPGAGVAGAVALGLAAACLGKAVAISLKHHSDDAELRRAADTCAQVARLALMDADQDAAEFAQFIHSHSREAAERLVDTGEALAKLRNVLVNLAESIEPRIEKNMAGDLLAARALAEAAKAVYAYNETEVKSG